MKTLITQCKQFVESVTDNALDNLNETELQKIIESSEEFQRDLLNCIKACIKKYSTPFASEKVKSEYRYPIYYHVKSVWDQIKTLKSFFPELKNATFDEEIIYGLPHPNAEGWFLIPRWEKIAKTYNKAVEKVLNAIKKQRKFYSFFEMEKGDLDSEHLRQSIKKEKMLKKIGEVQKNHDILVIAAQFGLRYRGCSPRGSLALMEDDEFGLGAFEVGIMLLTHPERLGYYYEDYTAKEYKERNLFINCPGDEYSTYPTEDILFSGTPYFDVVGEEIGVSVNFYGYAAKEYGSASGFISQ